MILKLSLRICNASVLLNQTALGPRTGDYLNPSLFDVGSVEILRVGRMPATAPCASFEPWDGTACATRSGADGVGALSVSITGRCRK